MGVEPQPGKNNQSREIWPDFLFRKNKNVRCSCCKYGEINYFTADILITDIVAKNIQCNRPSITGEIN